MIWLLSLIILLIPSYLVRFSLAGIPTTVFEVLLYIGVLATLVAQPLAVIGERLKPIIKRFGLPIGIFLVGSLIATVIAPDKRVALGLLKGYILDPLLLFGILIINVDTPEKLRRILQALCASAVAVALSVILGPKNNEGRALGLFAFDPDASPNFVALYLAPIATLAFAGALEKITLISRAKFWVTFAVSLAGILYSASRGGLLGLAFGIGLALIWLLTQRAPKAKSSFNGLAALFLIGSLLLGGWLSRPDFSATASHRASTSNNLRYEIWRTTLVDILPKKAILGVGLGNYQSYFKQVTAGRVNFPEFISPWARTPHNIFLTIWTNLGLIGLAGFVWLVILFFRTKNWPALKFAMAALLVHGLVDAAYWKNDLSALFWILLALSILSEELHKEKHDA